MTEMDKNEGLHVQPESDSTVSSTAEAGDQIDSNGAPSRRELIQRYAKYAVVAAPLLLFASKAHAIHSRP